MLTFFKLRKYIDLKAFIKVVDRDGYLLQTGVNGETMWDDDLLDKKVYLIIPGPETKIILKEHILNKWWP